MSFQFTKSLHVRVASEPWKGPAGVIASLALLYRGEPWGTQPG